MAVLNHLLWLKVRIATRVRSSRLANVLAVVGLVASLVLMVSAGGLLLVLVAEGGPDLGRPVMAAGLAMLYVSWVLAPALGYRLNEGLDPNHLAHYPTRIETLVLGSFLGNFVDPVVLVSAPIMLACLVAGGLLGGNPLVGGVAVLLFLFHAMGTTQIIHVTLIQLLRRRSLRDLLLVLVPAALLLGVFTLEYKIFQAGELGATAFSIETAQELRWLEHLLVLIPPGILMEALMPPSAHAIYGPTYACALLVPIAGLTVLIAARMVRASLEGEAGGGGGETREGGARTDRLVSWLTRWIPHPALAGRAAVELRLFCREPQYLLMYLIFLLMFGVLLGLEGPRGELETRAVAAPAVLFAAIFVFVGPMFNAFALERQGLRFAFSTPMEPVVYLIAKNIGTWIPVTLAHAAAASLASLTMGMGFLESMGYVLAGQVVIWILLGLGNVVSSLAPNPLPVHGMVPPRSVSFAQIAVTATVGSLGIFLGSMLAMVGCALIFGLPALLGKGGTSVFALVLGLAWVGGVYTVGTVLAARLLARRQEYLLEVLA